MTNPLEDNEARDQSIRVRAYHLWQADGSPEGREDEFWERASTLVGMEESAHAGELPNPASLPGADPDHQQIVDEAALQENLGEFPDRFADQGERTPTPSLAARKRAAG